jgi:hypothetical protein
MWLCACFTTAAAAMGFDVFYGKNLKQNLVVK